MAEQRIPVHVTIERDDLHGHDDVNVEGEFAIPVKSKMQGMAIAGIILFTIGFIVFAVMTGFFIEGYPEDWFPRIDRDTETVTNQDDLQSLKERVGVLGLTGAAFLFSGLAMYTYGRTYRGHEEVDQFPEARV